MEIWNVDDDGLLELPPLSGFAIGTLPNRLLVLQLRTDKGEEDDVSVHRCQVGISVETARALGNMLLQTVNEIEMAGAGGKMN